MPSVAFTAPDARVVVTNDHRSRQEAGVDGPELPPHRIVVVD